MLAKLTSALLISTSLSTQTIQLKEPFVVHNGDTVTQLYNAIGAKLSNVPLSCGISIIFGGKLILNLFDDHRTIEDIGMSEESNDIQIIQKPDVAALLEMVMDVRNTWNIPWFKNAMHCLNFLNDSSAIQNPNAFRFLSFEHGLEYDDNGYLKAIDLSHLNLMGTIHLESLPQTVRSVDLSFNDLDSLDLRGLRGKSVESLNLEQNKRCQLEIASFLYETKDITTLKELQLSSNQIYPRTCDPKRKRGRIKKWLSSRQALIRVIVDDQDIVRGTHKSALTLYSQMLGVVMGVTNKEMIPWFLPFSEGMLISYGEWQRFGVEHRNRTGRHRCNGHYRFNLSGLGLNGGIDLESLPRNVRELDLSNNNLSSIRFGDNIRVRNNLRALNLQNNDNLVLNVADIDRAKEACLSRLVRLSVSVNQLRAKRTFNEKRMTNKENVRLWLARTSIKIVLIQ